jgi:hypothetical protein
MASFSQITDEKLNALKFIVQRQQQNQMLSERTVKNTNVFVGTLVNLFVPNTIHLSSLHTALILLKHYILTFDILPYDQARSIMRQIR